MNLNKEHGCTFCKAIGDNIIVLSNTELNFKEEIIRYECNLRGNRWDRIYKSNQLKKGNTNELRKSSTKRFI